jgi:hypothetical protein
MSRHAELISEEQGSDPRWRHGRFRKTAMALIEKANDALGPGNGMPDLVESLHADLSFIPDLYYLTETPPCIAICEVECGHRVPIDKRDAIAFMGDKIEGLGISLRILIVDTHGGRTEVRWQDWYADWIKRSAQELYPDEPALQPPPAPAKRAVRVDRKRRRGRSLDEIIEASLARRNKSPSALA